MSFDLGSKATMEVMHSTSIEYRAQGGQYQQPLADMLINLKKKHSAGLPDTQVHNEQEKEFSKKRNKDPRNQNPS